MIVALLFFVFSLPIFGAENTDDENDVLKIKVEQNQTLFKIAKKYLDDPNRWREFLKFNKIANPNLIYPGQTLKVPGFLRKKSLASVVLKIGNAKYREDGEKNWKDAFVSLKLFTRDLVRTNQDGRVQLKLFNKSIFKIFPNSMVQIGAKNIKSLSGTISLMRGSALAIINEINAGAPSFKIRTNSTVMAVRGTEFFAKADDKVSLLAVYDGTVDATASEKTVSVPKGFGTVVKKGNPPLTPFRLLAPPKVFTQKN